MQALEWKIGIDGRRTHLALGFERSSLVRSARTDAIRGDLRLYGASPTGSRSVSLNPHFSRVFQRRLGGGACTRRMRSGTSMVPLNHEVLLGSAALSCSAASALLRTRAA